MKTELIFALLYKVILFMSCLAEDEEIFTDYCRSGLCENNGGDGMHTGCKKGVRHNGQFQIPPCKKDSKMINLTDVQKQEILHFHNYQRNYLACGGLVKYYGIKPACRMGVMKWDKELEATAFLHVSYCTFDHDKCRNTLKYPYSGQNLAIMTANSITNTSRFTSLFTIMWYLEYQDATPKLIDKYKSEKNGPMTGHFLASVNEKNSRIGCALGHLFEVTKKKKGVLFSCNYAITNFRGAPTYSTCKNPASKCLTGKDPKYPYLCSSNEVYEWDTIIDLQPFDGDGTEVYNNCGPSPEEVQNAPANAIKPKTEKPSKGTPGEIIDYDYSDHEYDPPDSSSTQTWRQNFYLKIFLMVIVPSEIILIQKIKCY